MSSVSLPEITINSPLLGPMVAVAGAGDADGSRGRGWRILQAFQGDLEEVATGPTPWPRRSLI